MLLGLVKLSKLEEMQRCCSTEQKKVMKGRQHIMKEDLLISPSFLADHEGEDLSDTTENPFNNVYFILFFHFLAFLGTLLMDPLLK